MAIEFHSEYDKNYSKIIFEENAYVRLQGIANLTSFTKGMTSPEENVKGGREFLTFLYGKKDSYGNFIFNKVSNVDYEPMDGRAPITSEMLKELTQMAINPEVDSIIFFHTHPNGLTESSRFFSEGDLSFYRNTLTSSILIDALKKDDPSFEKDIMFFNGMISNSRCNDLPENDDINIIYYDKTQDKFINMINIHVRIHEQLVPLTHIEEKIYKDEKGKLYNENEINGVNVIGYKSITRTLLDVRDAPYKTR